MKKNLSSRAIPIVKSSLFCVILFLSLGVYAEPSAENDSYVTYSNTSVIEASPGVLSNDSGANLSAVLVSGPSNGRLELKPDGSFRYTPALNAVGDDSFTYKAFNGSQYSAEATVSITITDPLNQDNVLYITPRTPIYVQPGGAVMAGLNIANLSQRVNGCQAFINFNSLYFKNGFTDVSVLPGGGAWNQLIYYTHTANGDLDLAVGVDLFLTQGTQADGVIASIMLSTKSNAQDGITHIAIRPDADPDPGLLQTTIFATVNGLALYPNKVQSADIFIDGTNPTLSIINAVQNSANLIPGGTASVGTIIITIEANDELSGLSNPPSVVITPSGSSSESASYHPELSAPQNGIYVYTWEITNTVNDGAATIQANASDMSGNISAASAQFNIQKQTYATLTGKVILEDIVGYNPNYSYKATFKIYQAGNQNCAAPNVVATAPLSSDGSYTLNIPQQGVDCRVVVKAGTQIIQDPSARYHFLAKKISNVNLSQNAILPTVHLPNGDINDDNVIDAFDFTLLMQAYDIAEDDALGQSDLTNDGFVDAFDFTILMLSYDSAGDECN